VPNPSICVLRVRLKKGTLMTRIQPINKEIIDLTLSLCDVPRLSQGEGRYAMLTEKKLTKKQISIIFRFNPISSRLAVPLFFQYQCFF